jgi:hypothetical protein
MPFFFIAPIWLFCVVVGLALCFFRQFRFLSSYVILGSTGGLILSFALSTFVLWIGPRLLGSAGTWAGLMLIAAYLAAIAVGGLVGIIAGFLTARKINQLRHWTPVQPEWKEQ